ncbi:cell division control protein [Dispira simplex]|nr:cell division control protein [Dispira simplex]KAJ1653086.1 cell division control protein [Dispira simplex]
MFATAQNPTSLNSYVGFDTVTQQIERKFLKRGFNFNIILVGETGLGKSTLLNTIFSAHLMDSKGRKSAVEAPRQTVDITPVTHLVEEKGVKMRLTIVDTPGYADQVNNDQCWKPIVKYITDQHRAYLERETAPSRDRFIPDTRVHCCLYFISPSGHSLKALDIEVLRHLTQVVNVVPVIAKADSLTPEERIAFKRRIKEELVYHKINVYPYASEEDDDSDKSLLQEIKTLTPFSVVGSENVYEVNGKVIRGRRHRWGVIDVEDVNHCDFVHLRNFLTRTHLHDLVETTAHIHYETFRYSCLNPSPNASPASMPPTSPMAIEHQHIVNGTNQAA